jgi:hypothetical protein
VLVVANVEALGTKFNEPAVTAYEEETELDAHDALLANVLCVAVVAEFGTKLMDVARIAVVDHEAVPNVDPVCGPIKEPLAYDALIEEVEKRLCVVKLAALGTKFTPPATDAYEDDTDDDAHEAEIA